MHRRRDVDGVHLEIQGDCDSPSCTDRSHRPMFCPVREGVMVDRGIRSTWYAEIRDVKDAA
jgi:hypothetical protein